MYPYLPKEYTLPKTETQTSIPQSQSSLSPSKSDCTDGQNSPRKLMRGNMDKNVLSERICISDKEVQLVSFLGRKITIDGKLIVTNYSITFLTGSPIEKENILFQMPIGYIWKTERSLEYKSGSIIDLLLRFGWSLKLKYSDKNYETSNRSNIILANLIETSTKYLPVSETLFTLESCDKSEYQKIFDIADSQWYENDGWAKYPAYPERFKVPTPYLGKNNPEYRLVILSFVYQAKEKVGFWRTGPGRPDPSEDDWILKSKMFAKLFIIEIRSKAGTKSNASLTIYLYTLSSLRDSFVKLWQLYYYHNDPQKWITVITQTRWYEQIGILLTEASRIVHKISHLVHVTLLAELEARGAQLSVLVQILLFPYCRTLKGFGKLLEREFLQFGLNQSGKRDRYEDKGIFLIQLLDAVYQLTCIYPLSFYYSQNLLVMIAENIYSNRYGNFLLISKGIKVVLLLTKETERAQAAKCSSIWSDISKIISYGLASRSACELQWKPIPMPSEPYSYSQLINPFYVDFQYCDIYYLKQDLSSIHLKPWGAFFFKKFGYSNNKDYEIYMRYEAIALQHLYNKAYTYDYRRKIALQHMQIIDKKNIINTLKT